VAIATLAQRTLGVQEVGNGNGMRSVSGIWCFEDLLNMSLRVDAHVLLSESFGMLLDVCVLLEAVSASFIAEQNSYSDDKDDLQAVPTKVSSSASTSAYRR
jgi:hypothetical protein